MISCRIFSLSIFALCFSAYAQTSTPTPTNTPAPTPTPAIGDMFGRRGDPNDSSKAYRLPYSRTSHVVSEGISIVEPQETRVYDPYARPFLDYDGQFRADILNLLTNVEFEGSILPWTGDAQMTETYDSTESDIGSTASGSMQCVADGVSTATVQYDLSDYITKGDFYTFGARVSPSTDCTISLLIESTSPEQTFTKSYDLLLTDGEWQLLSITAKLPDDSYLEAVEFNTDDAVTFHVDNVGVFRAGFWPGFSPALGVLDATTSYADLSVSGDIAAGGSITAGENVSAASLVISGTSLLTGQAEILDASIGVATIQSATFTTLNATGPLDIGPRADATPTGGWDADNYVRVHNHSGDAEVSITSNANSILNLGDDEDEDIANIQYFNSSNTLRFTSAGVTGLDLTVTGLTAPKAAEFNSTAADADFRVNWDSGISFYVDGTDGQVLAGPAISGSLPDGDLHIIGTSGAPIRVERTGGSGSDNEWSIQITAPTGGDNGSLVMQPNSVSGTAASEADFAIQDLGSTVSLLVDNSANDVKVPNGDIETTEIRLGNSANFSLTTSGSDFQAGTAANPDALQVNTTNGNTEIDGSFSCPSTISSTRGTGGAKRVYGDSGDWVADNLASGGNFYFKNSAVATVFTIDNDGDCTAAKSLTAGTYIKGGGTTLAASSSTETFVQTHDVILVTATRVTGSECTFASAGTAGRIIKVVVVAASTYYIEVPDATYQDVPSTRTLYAGDTMQFISDGTKWRELSYTDNTP